MAAKKCMIIGASPLKSGDIFKEYNIDDFYVICADGGYDTALQYGVKIDYVIGDFDSAKNIPAADSSFTVKKIPVEKDATDTMYAAYIGMKLGYKDFVLIGCIGGERYDHFLANLNVLVYLSNKGLDAVMADDSSRVFVLRGRRLRLKDMKGKTVSVFPFGTNTCNLTYKGLKYPLNEEDLKVGDTIMGVSNSVVDNNAEIVVNAGSALIVVYTDK
jgi:thiamine pyrophosphokinase